MLPFSENGAGTGVEIALGAGICATAGCRTSFTVRWLSSHSASTAGLTGALSGAGVPSAPSANHGVASARSRAFVAVVEPHCTKNPRCDSALFVMRLEPVARADSPPLPMYRISRISAICFFTNCRRWACSVAREFSARPRGLEGEIGPWDREPEPLLDMDTPWGLPPEPLPALRGDEADTPGEEPGELNPTDT